MYGSTNAEKLFTRCVEAGMTEAGASGILGNIYHESGILPNNLENAAEKRLGMNDNQYVAAVDKGTYKNFATDKAGFGLAQWTYESRKKSLYNYLKGKKLSIADFAGQADYLIIELMQYTNLWKVLTTTTDVQTASDRVLVDFERPANQSATVKNQRGATAKKYYAEFATEHKVHPALEKLAKLGVISSLDYWKRAYHQTQYLDKLILSATDLITKKGTRYATVQTAVKALQSAGVINTPSYWEKMDSNVGELLKALGGAVNASVKKETTAATKTADTVTGDYLRQSVCDIMNSWVGAKRGSDTHLRILSIYNTHKPLPRGYQVKVNDAHCATTASAALIAAGLGDYVPLECSCYYLIEAAKKLGFWVENDAYVPKLGDLVLYDWQDTGIGDNTGNPDHVGIVTQPGSTQFIVTEGNINGGQVGKRTMAVNGRYIRGFISIDYDAIAKKLGKKPATQVPVTNTNANKTYTVVKNDSLWGIAQKMLGDGKRYPEIITLNGLKGTNPTIHPGDVLKLP